MTTKITPTVDKVVKTRDTATSILRKLGIDKKSYNDHITKERGGFHVVVQSRTTKTSKGEVKTTETLGRPGTLAYDVRVLVMAGKTNREILEQLCDDGRLDATTQKHYPAWFRAELVRKGVAVPVAR